KAGVTYVYEKAAGVTRDLPQAISDPTTPGDYQVGDNTQYYIGATVTRNHPAKSSYDEQDDAGVTIGTWTLTWEKTTDTMVAGGIRFIGKWTYTEAPKDKVTYSYIAAPGSTRSLPSDISNPSTPGDYQVGDSTKYYIGATVTRNHPAKSSYDEKDDVGVTVGTWTLTWDKTSAPMPVGG
ncbi:SHIRT domain-containing protein, partial [Streptococcus minor]|uniref:SHIRT domain-containing protein n=1 Tax=Streptococcus minor TaxID=229549 RepID=UPI001C8A408E